MEFSTQTTASLHQVKTAALAVGVYADGVLSPAADIIAVSYTHLTLPTKA